MGNEKGWDIRDSKFCNLTLGEGNGAGSSLGSDIGITPVDFGSSSSGSSGSSFGPQPDYTDYSVDNSGGGSGYAGGGLSGEYGANGTNSDVLGGFVGDLKGLENTWTFDTNGNIGKTNEATGATIWSDLPTQTNSDGSTSTDWSKAIAGVASAAAAGVGAVLAGKKATTSGTSSGGASAGTTSASAGTNGGAAAASSTSSLVIPLAIGGSVVLILTVVMVISLSGKKGKK